MASNIGRPNRTEVERYYVRDNKVDFCDTRYEPSIVLVVFGRLVVVVMVLQGGHRCFALRGDAPLVMRTRSSGVVPLFLIVPCCFRVCGKTGLLFIIAEIMIVDVIDLFYCIEDADKLSICSRRGLHDGIQVMVDICHGGDDVIVSLGFKIGFLIQISETFQDFVKGKVDLRYRRNNVFNVTDVVFARSNFVR